MVKINKKILIGVLVAVVLIFAGIFGIIYYRKGKIPSKKEVAPEKEEAVEEVLERLTPAEPKPLTKEEQEKLEGLLSQLTPTQPKPMTEEEQKELEELLKQLTP